MSFKKIVAKVDGSEIFMWQYNDAIASYSSEVLKKTPEELTPSEYSDCTREALDKLLAGEVFYLEAIEAGFSISEEEVKNTLQDFIDSQSYQKYKMFLNQRELTEEEFKAYIRKQIIKERFVDAILKKIPPLTKEEVENYYNKIKDKISLPPRFSFTVLYVENPSEEEKENFKKLLYNVVNKKIEPVIAEKIFSDLPNVVKRVKVAHFEDKSSDEFAPQIKNLLLELSEHSFSPIYEAPDEISIFYIKKKELNIPMSEEEGRKEAEKYLNVVRLKKILDNYVQYLKEKRKIKVYL